MDRHIYRDHTILKVTNTVYFSSSLYIKNQKPMIPRTHFHCITMGCTLFRVKFGHAFAYFVVLVYKTDGAIIQYKFLF